MLLGFEGRELQSVVCPAHGTESAPSTVQLTTEERSPVHVTSLDFYIVVNHGTPSCMQTPDPMLCLLSFGAMSSCAHARQTCGAEWMSAVRSGSKARMAPA